MISPDKNGLYPRTAAAFKITAEGSMVSTAVANEIERECLEQAEKVDKLNEALTRTHEVLRVIRPMITELAEDFEKQKLICQHLVSLLITRFGNGEVRITKEEFDAAPGFDSKRAEGSNDIILTVKKAVEAKQPG